MSLVTPLAVLIVLLVIAFILKGLIVVRQANVVIVERIGKYNRTLQSGLNLILPIIETTRKINWRFITTDMKGNTIITTRTLSKIDLRETVYDFPKQNVITADNVSIEINALLYFQITDPKRAVYEIENLPNAIEKITQTTLRNVIGELELDKTLTSRDTINSKLRVILDEATDKWGVKVNRVELQDINPPIDIKNAMEKQMRAERDRRAKILEAEGEKTSQILVAEGARESEVERANGEAQAKLILAEAEAKAINLVAEAIKSTKMEPAEYLIALKYIEAFKNIVQNGDKTVVLPYESSAILGSIKSIKDMFNK